MIPLTITDHVNKWKGCTQCEYGETRHKIVLGKGDIPCDILFCGEAPGASENVLGLPFIGKAGKILDRIVYKVFGSPQTNKYRIAYNNIIACIPLVDGHEKEVPDDECIVSCRERLEEFIKIASPKLIIAVGKLSDDWLDQTYKHAVRVPNKTPIVAIQHPASILRMPVAGQSLAEHRCAVIISTAVNQYLGG